jgi:hypothetical protein
MAVWRDHMAYGWMAEELDSSTMVQLDGQMAGRQYGCIAILLAIICSACVAGKI